MNEEWYNDRIRMADDPDWVSARVFCFSWYGLVNVNLSSGQTTNLG